MLSLEEMIENDYPMPSYMADIFEKPLGWVETPDAPKASLLAESTAALQDRIFAIDCEMVCVCTPFLYHPLIGGRY